LAIGFNNTEVSELGKFLIKIRKGESGQALLLALIMLALGSMFIAPSLTLASTTLKTGQMVEENMNGIYAADAGTEDAMWRILNDMPASFPYAYQIPSINGMSVDVVIEEVTSINGQQVDPPAGHVDWMEITKSIGESSNNGESIYYYTLSVTNYDTSNIKVESILIDFPPELEYSAGSTSSNITTGDPSISGTSALGITLVWTNSAPYPTIGSDATEEVIFQLTGPSGVEGVEGHCFVQARRNDVSTVADADSHPLSITAQAKNAADEVVATLKMGVWEGGQLDISYWELNP